MKIDKRNYLKLAFLFQCGYIIIFLINEVYNYKGLTDKLISYMFLLVIGFVCSYILYEYSKLSLEKLKTKKLRISLCSLYLLFYPIFPGIFGFMFLYKSKEKEELMLPQVNVNNKNNYIKTIILLIAYTSIFVFDLSSYINPLCIYIITFIAIILFHIKELICEFKAFKNNIVIYIKYIFRSYLKLLSLLFVLALFVSYFIKDVSTNQKMVLELLSSNTLIALFLITIYAPIVEELMFRKTLHNLIKNKWVFIVVSGLIFGALHVLPNITGEVQYLFIVMYGAIGSFLAYTYYKTKNIFVPISIHFIQNTLSALLSLLLARFI